MSRAHARLATFLILSLLACSSTAPKPKTGDVSFRVTWTGESDIDLYVRSPLGEQINYVLPGSDSGGELDIDCNFHGVRMCEVPMENIFWPPNRAPHGSYVVWIILPDPTGLLPEDEYRLEVRFGREVIWRVEGLVTELQERTPVLEVNFPGGEVVPRTD